MRVLLVSLSAVLIGVLLSREIAMAECRVTATSGDDDIVVCGAPDDPDGIYTSSGDDTVTVESGVMVTSTSSTYNTIRTSTGNDKVYNYGSVISPLDPVDLDTGRDELHNRGLLEGDDDGVGCSPRNGELCSIYNYNGGTIRAVMEAVDYHSTSGATGYIWNEGTIESTTEEAVHLNSGTSYQVMNMGTILAGTSGIEVFAAAVSVTNYGLIEADGESESGAFQEYAINFDVLADTLINYGTIVDRGNPAVSGADGADVVENYGTIRGTANGTSEGVIETDEGNDRIVNSGDIISLGSGYAAIEAGSGSDTVIIKGGSVQKQINGDKDGGSGDYDILTFEFTGTQAQVDAFVTRVNTQTPANGSATWHGNTYTWKGFEEIRLQLTADDDAPTATPTNTPQPTNTPKPPTSTPQPTSTAQPTSTSQPTNTPKPPTNTPQPTSTQPPPSGTLANGSFESATNLLPDLWTGKQLNLSPNVDGQDCGQRSGGSCSMRLLGDGNSSKLIQDLMITGAQGDSYVLTFDTMSSGVSGSGSYKVMVKVFYTDGTKKNFKVKLPAGTNPWTSYEIPITAERSYTKIQVIIQFTMPSGSAWFDNFALTEQ